MNKNFRSLLTLIDLIALVITVVWYYQTQDWEPLAGIFVTASALLPLLFSKRSDVNVATEPGSSLQSFTDIYTDDLDEEYEPQSLDNRKKLTHILFVDDDPKFKVVSILKTAGWINTKAVKDIYNYDDPVVNCAHMT